MQVNRLSWERDQNQKDEGKPKNSPIMFLHKSKLEAALASPGYQGGS
jgi:hypothetical protein